MEDQINFEELQKSIKNWADEQDKLNRRGPDEVWAKVEKYGWLATLSHRVGLQNLEDVNLYDSENQSTGSESSAYEVASNLNVSQNSDTSETASEVTLKTSETDMNISVYESVRTPDMVEQENVT